LIFFFCLKKEQDQNKRNELKARREERAQHKKLFRFHFGF